MSMMTEGTEKPFLSVFSVFLLFLYVSWRQLILHPNFLFSFEKRWAGLYWQVAWGSLGIRSLQAQGPPFKVVPEQTSRAFLLFIWIVFCRIHMSLHSCHGNPFCYGACNRNKKQSILHWSSPTNFSGFVFCCGNTPELQASMYTWLCMTHRTSNSPLWGLRCLL